MNDPNFASLEDGEGEMNIKGPIGYAVLHILSHFFTAITQGSLSNLYWWEMGAFEQLIIARFNTGPFDFKVCSILPYLLYILAKTKPIHYYQNHLLTSICRRISGGNEVTQTWFRTFYAADEHIRDSNWAYVT